MAGILKESFWFGTIWPRSWHTYIEDALRNLFYREQSGKRFSPELRNDECASAANTAVRDELDQPGPLED
jgi:hypothetical protein